MQHRQHPEFPWRHNLQPQGLLPPQHNHQPQELLPPQHNHQPQELLPWHNQQPQELLQRQHQDGMWQHHHYDQQYRPPLHNHPAALGLPPRQPQELQQRQHQEGLWQHHHYDQQHQQPLHNRPAALGLPPRQPQELLRNIQIQLQELLQSQHQEWQMPHHHYDHQHQQPFHHPGALGLPPRQIQQPIVRGNLPQVVDGGVLGAHWARDFARTNEDLCRHFNIFVGGLPPEFNDRALYQFFTEYRSLERAEVHLFPESNKSRGYGYVTFGRFEEAQAAIDKYHGKKVGNRKLECYWAAGHDRTVVYVDNLPPEKVTKDNLICHFNSKTKSGRIKSVSFDHSKDHAYVRYSAHTDALRAIHHVHNTKLFGEYTIKCSWAWPYPY